MPVLGLDIGTQSLKAIILDDGLAVRGTGMQAYTYAQPRPGWAEQHTGHWLAALRPAITDALVQARMPPADIAAVAISGQLDGCVPVDARGNALSDAIIWMDRRATSVTACVEHGTVSAHSGLVCDPTHMAAKIAWMKQNGLSGACLWHQPVSFVVSGLTGRAHISHSLASTTMLYSLDAHDWDAVLLEMFGVSPVELPALGNECDVCGGLTLHGADLTGLLPGTPVAIGTGDDFGNLVGCGVGSPGLVAVSLGTAEAVATLSDRLLVDGERLVETHAFPGGFYHLGNPGWLCGGAVRWASALLGCASDTEFMALAEQAPPGCDGLVFIPALTGAMAPRWNPAARGSFIGLAAGHERRHMVRAVLEGTAFAVRDVVERLAALGAATDRLRLMGGGAQSRLWCGIKADVTGRPVEIQDVADASALGAALIAAVAAGIAPTLAEAIRRRACDLPLITPEQSRREAYDRSYRFYRDAFAALDPYWPAMDDAMSTTRRSAAE